MKKTFCVMLLAMLPLAFTSCGDDDENINPQNQENGNNNPMNPSTPVVQDIVVTIDANGNANEGHRFSRIDDTSFYIDEIKYTASQGDLYVSGYDKAFFKGAANIITTLDYNGLKMNVTSIESSAFSGCTVLTSVTIPNSVTSIGYSAFSGCTGLTSITIGNSVTRIGNFAFDGCTGLTSVIINSPTIRASWFAGITSIKELIIGESVTSIDEDVRRTFITPHGLALETGCTAFFGCSGLTSIVVESGNPTYDSRENCNAIIETESNTLLVGCNTTNIPNSVTSIGGGAFFGCSGLTSITIPNSVTSIGNSAFYGCSGLTSIAIPNSVTRIEHITFYGCSGLTSITIPKRVTSIGEYAFYRCSGLNSVTINCATIGSWFSGNTSIKKLIIGKCVTEIGARAFYGCSGLTFVTIGSSVTSIGNCAFELCTGLTSITIPNSVTSIGYDAFLGCSSLADVYCKAINVPHTSSDTFESSNIKNATLHVPAESIDLYKSSWPWKNFGSIVAIE